MVLEGDRTPFDVLPTLGRDYAVQANLDGEWTTVGGETANRRRHRVFTLDPAVRTAVLRVLVDATNGARRAHVVSLRVYPPAG